MSGGRQLRIVLKVSKAEDGSLTALNYSIDQSPQPMRTADVSLRGNVFHYAVPSLGNSYEGKLSADGNSIAGNWAQTVPLNFMRATKETAWEIPQPAPVLLKPMTVGEIHRLRGGNDLPSNPVIPQSMTCGRALIWRMGRRW